MERRELEEILRGIEAARADNLRTALCTVVRVRGSAYRREGAKMLVSEDGSHVCMLSGGCLEPEVAIAAQDVIVTGTPKVVSYDLSEEVVWGLGIGCGGSVDILIEPVQDNPLLKVWLEVLKHGALGVAATVLISESEVQRVLVQPDGKLQGSTDPVLMGHIRSTALEMMASLYPRAETKAVHTLRHSTDVFFDASSPAARLVIFGAGHDAVPLNSKASALGWTTVVVDTREAFLSAGRFPGATLVNPGIHFAERLTLHPKDFCVVMNHHLERDASSLKFCLETGPAYIGVLGPRARYQDLLERLRIQGFTIPPSSLESVRNPIGLDIGAESPEEVALSIVAELLAVRRGFEGGILNGREGRIHDPRAEQAAAV
jgi:xanthine dehydrogenase accessory factor